ncbi:MAG: guanylate kinase [Ignavibacteria bacterium]|nr:guanylate kinase [Ignavibacteria bacterium]MBT8383220.1 guanylate kinase [Ignavibacteria bacterium]MBT8392177.1 guanylate kinase [Ignavibacteria bacterium]NNJ53837.1 guanylate kinase [Ignavibacteriaceae bacterium]NNL20512.1 guanylate kinase [Ignavibacteriaceae bacterium]
MKGEIIAVAAPSGAGKTTIVKRILAQFPEFVFSISATTRPIRETEKNGVEYYFITEEEFKQKIKHNEFIEWEKFYDYYYGTYKSVINKTINSGKPVLLEVDVKGALSIKKLYPFAHLIYISPPSYKELVTRLRERKTENEEDFNKRIKRAKMELSLKDKFDYIIVNENLEKAVEQTSDLVTKILKGEKN